MGASIAVDIGTSGVRVVETVAGARSVTVRRAGAAPLAPGVVIEGIVHDKAAVASALRSLWRKHRFRSRNVALTIGSYQQIIIRTAEVPYLPGGKHMDGLVASAATSAMPVDVAGLVMSHHVVSVREVLDENNIASQKADVVITGAHRPAVTSLIDAVELAGLHPTSIDVTPFALTRFVTEAGSGPGRLDFILHVGAETVVLIGITDGQFASLQPMAQFSGEMITEAIFMEISGGTRATAEKLKLTAGSASSLAPQPGADDVGPILAAWTTSFVREARDAIQSASRAIGMPIGRVWLTGGGSRLAGIAPRLGAELGDGASVALLDPSAWVSSPDKLLRVAESTGQDLTVALAASIK